jgi:2-polyprenyl-6-methoxyphenol hydroxylase-like FAD-dependent oxidoreductase
VTGVRIQGTQRQATEDCLDADLTVVGTGRSGRAARWLEELGYDAPAEEQQKIDLMYVSCRLKIAAETLGKIRTVLIGPVPARPTGMGLFEQENDTWNLTASGYAGHHPPTEWPALLAFLRRQVPEPIVTAVEQAERLTPLQAYHYPTSLRRRYDTMKRFPQGVLVVGDAVCSFNPLYGQGMTVAALQALALSESLAGGIEGLARRYYQRATKPINVAWQLSTSADLALPPVPGPRPLPLRVLNTYVDAVQAAAEQDPAVVTSFLRVTSLLDPPSRLLTPSTVVRVARAGRLQPRRG